MATDGINGMNHIDSNITTQTSGMMQRAGNFFLRNLDNLASHIPKDLFTNRPNTARAVVVFGLVAGTFIAYKALQKVCNFAASYFTKPGTV